MARPRLRSCNPLDAVAKSKRYRYNWSETVKTQTRRLDNKYMQHTEIEWKDMRLRCARNIAVYWTEVTWCKKEFSWSFQWLFEIWITCAGIKTVTSRKKMTNWKIVHITDVSSRCEPIFSTCSSFWYFLEYLAWTIFFYEAHLLLNPLKGRITEELTRNNFFKPMIKIFY